MSLTRWQSFRQKHRHHVLRKGIYLAGMCLLLSVYSYALFRLPPSASDRSHDAVVTWNAVLKERARIAEVERKAKRMRVQEEAVKQQHDEPTTAAGGGNRTAEATDEESSATRKDIKSRAEDRTLGYLMIYSLAWYVVGLAVYICLRVCTGGGEQQSSTRALRRQQRLLREERRLRFRAWAQRLNWQRQTSGQPPISVASLELVMRERDMTGDDYDNLLQFEEEGGAAMEALLNGIGASQYEIDRCPLRKLESSDYEFLARTVDGKPQLCAICLENYQVGQEVRTIPCFHNFHKSCIDPWLSQRAVCPVCKHSVIS